MDKDKEFIRNQIDKQFLDMECFDSMDWSMFDITREEYDDLAKYLDMKVMNCAVYGHLCKNGLLRSIVSPENVE